MIHVYKLVLVTAPVSSLKKIRYQWILYIDLHIYITIIACFTKLLSQYTSLGANLPPKSEMIPWILLTCSGHHYFHLFSPTQLMVSFLEKYFLMINFLANMGVYFTAGFHYIETCWQKCFALHIQKILVIMILLWYTNYSDTIIYSCWHYIY